MAHAARWIRSALAGHHDLCAARSGLALAQHARAAPIVFWARAGARAPGQSCASERDHFAFALIAPLRFAPGRRSRWCAWALAPALAAYRQFGVRAYLDGDGMCLNGGRIAECGAQEIGACAVVVSSFLPRPPGARGEWPERELEDAFRTRIEVQHGWQFENSWPSQAERLAIADALTEEAADAK